MVETDVDESAHSRRRGRRGKGASEGRDLSLGRRRTMSSCDPRAMAMESIMRMILFGSSAESSESTR